MDTTKFFKNLLIIQAIFFGIVTILSVLEPIEYINFMTESISLINSETYAAISLIILFLFIVSLYLSYRLSSLGRNLYLSSTILTFLILPISDVAFTGLTYSAVSLSSMLSGVIIYLMFFTEIKDKFN